MLKNLKLIAELLACGLAFLNSETKFTASSRTAGGCSKLDDSPFILHDYGVE